MGLLRIIILSIHDFYLDIAMSGAIKIYTTQSLCDHRLACINHIKIILFSGDPSS